MNRIKSISTVVLLLILAGCYYDKEDQLYVQPSGGSGCDTSNVTYTTTIKTILDNSCALSGCHDAQTKSFGYDLSNYNGAVAGTQGRLLGAIRHDNGFIAMPKGMAKLSDCDIAKITAWINSGTPQ